MTHECESAPTLSTSLSALILMEIYGIVPMGTEQLKGNKSWKIQKRAQDSGEMSTGAMSIHRQMVTHNSVSKKEDVKSTFVNTFV